MMKIAIATDDRVSISPHFGRAKSFVIVTMEDGKIKSEEFREAIGGQGTVHGRCDHSAMIDNLRDCQVVISYGMGWSIYEELRANKIQSIVTDRPTVQEALQAYIKGELENRTDKLH